MLKGYIPNQKIGLYIDVFLSLIIRTSEMSLLEDLTEIWTYTYIST